MDLALRYQDHSLVLRILMQYDAVGPGSEAFMGGDVAASLFHLVRVIADSS